MSLMHSLVELTQAEKVRAHYSTLYLLACDLPSGEVLVKIGCSERPKDRYAALLTGVGLPSVMYWTPAGAKYGGSLAEASCHKELKEFHSAREWFIFKDESGLQRLREVVAWAIGWGQPTPHPPEWRQITEAQISELNNQKIKASMSKRRWGDSNGYKRAKRL